MTTVRTDQAWFFTPQWLAGEREADEEIAAGWGTVYETADDMFAHLEAQPALERESAHPTDKSASLEPSTADPILGLLESRLGVCSGESGQTGRGPG